MHFPSRSREERELQSEQQCRRAPPCFLDGRHKRLCAARPSHCAAHAPEDRARGFWWSARAQTTAKLLAPLWERHCSSAPWRPMAGPRTHTGGVRAPPKPLLPRLAVFRPTLCPRSQRHSAARSLPDCPRALAGRDAWPVYGSLRSPSAALRPPARVLRADAKWWAAGSRRRRPLGRETIGGQRVTMRGGGPDGSSDPQLWCSTQRWRGLDALSATSQWPVGN